MNKISPIITNKIKNTSKNFSKPLLTSTLLGSCCLLKQNKEDTFIKTETEISLSELESICKKNGRSKEDIESILYYYSKAGEEKKIIKPLLELTKTRTKSLPLFSFIKIKEKVPVIHISDLLKIIEQVSKKCSDIDFVIELINLQKEETDSENKTQKVSFWNDGVQLLRYIKGAENKKLKEMMQNSIHSNLTDFSNLEIFCAVEMTEEAMDKYRYLQKTGLVNSNKHVGSVSIRKGNTDTEEFIKKIKILQSLSDSLDKDIYFTSANNAFSSKDWEKIVNTCLERGESKEEILETLFRLINNDVELWENFYKNPLLKDIKIYHIVNSLDNNKDFILELSKQEDFPKDLLAGIAHRTTNSVSEIMKTLCKDENIDKKQILKYYDQLLAIPTIDFNYLDISQAYRILDLLKKYDDDIKIFAKKFNINIDQIITRINNYIGGKRNVIITQKKQQVEFFRNIITNNNSETEKILKDYNFTQFGKKGLPLKYTREEFNKNIKSLLEELSPEEQTKVCNHFGLIKGELDGFNGLFNNADYEKDTASEKEFEIAKKVQAEINKFTVENEVLISNEKVKKVLDSLVKGLPEFTTLIGKEQHGTHEYSVDIHSLLVLQKAMNNPLYESLNNSDKTILKISALLHDIGKREGVIDSGHAKTSSEYVRSILEKFDLPEKIKHKIIVTVDSHHWFEVFCRKTDPKNPSSKFDISDIFANAHSPRDLKIFEILAKADFQSVSSTFHLKRSNVSNEKDFDKYIQGKMDSLETLASDILFKYSNFLKTTKFTTKLFPEVKVKIDGEKTSLRVLNLNKISANEDMRKYGFGCKSKDDLRFLVHMTHEDEESFDALLKITRNPLTQKLWSTSLIKPGHDVTYMQRAYGGILEGDSSNFITAYKTNTMSGTRKNKDTYKSFINTNLKIELENRSFLKDALLKILAKKGFKLSEDDYIKLSRHILSTEDYSSLEDFKINNQTISSEIIINAIEKAQEKLFVKNTQNEIVGIDLKLKALVAKAKKIEDCDPRFLRFARDNNLDIILI